MINNGRVILSYHKMLSSIALEYFTDVNRIKNNDIHLSRSYMFLKRSDSYKIVVAALDLHGKGGGGSSV